jgi:hypothetical protein
MKLFVRAKSKAELNRKLRQGVKVTGLEYSLLRQGIEFTLGVDVPDKARVFLFTKIQNGFPLAHSNGTYNYNKNQVQ